MNIVFGILGFIFYLISELTEYLGCITLTYTFTVLSIASIIFAVLKDIQYQNTIHGKNRI